MGNNPFDPIRRNPFLREVLSREPEKKPEPLPPILLRRSPSSTVPLPPGTYPFNGGFINGAAVYMILDSGFNVLYVGETTDLARRMTEHKNDRTHLMHRHAPAYVHLEFGVEDETHRRSRERALILRHSPPCNRCL